MRRRQARPFRDHEDPVRFGSSGRIDDETAGQFPERDGRPHRGRPVVIRPSLARRKPHFARLAGCHIERRAGGAVARAKAVHCQVGVEVVANGSDDLRALGNTNQRRGHGQRRSDFAERLDLQHGTIGSLRLPLTDSRTKGQRQRALLQGSGGPQIVVWEDIRELRVRRGRGGRLPCRPSGHCRQENQTRKPLRVSRLIIRTLLLAELFHRIEGNPVPPCTPEAYEEQAGGVLSER